MKYLFISVLLLSSLMAAGQGRNQPAFSFFDADEDGMITKEEYEFTHQKRLDKKKEEGKMLRNQANAPAFESIDTDGDGLISPKEFSAHQAARRAQ